MALINYNKVIQLVKQNFKKISAEDISTKSGYEKAVLYMKDILQQANVPEDSQRQYLSRETLIKCIKEAENHIIHANQKAENLRLAEIKK